MPSESKNPFLSTLHLGIIQWYNTNTCGLDMHTEMPKAVRSKRTRQGTGFNFEKFLKF